MFYIYERASTYIMGGVNKWDGTVRPDHRKSYKTMPAARAALTRMSKRHRADMLESVNDPQYRFGIAEAEHFHKTVEKSRTGYMSPRSEAYWSM